MAEQWVVHSSLSAYSQGSRLLAGHRQEKATLPVSGIHRLWAELQGDWDPRKAMARSQTLVVELIELSLVAFLSAVETGGN